MTALARVGRQFNCSLKRAAVAERETLTIAGFESRDIAWMTQCLVFVGTGEYGRSHYLNVGATTGVKHEGDITVRLRNPMQVRVLPAALVPVWPKWIRHLTLNRRTAP